MIVKAGPEHLNEINRIYNQAVEQGLCTAHLRPVTLEERREWFQKHHPDEFPVFLFLEKGNVRGWLSVSPYRPGRGALDEVTEISYYVDFGYHGKGIGSRLMEHAIGWCKETRFRILVAILISGNDTSVKLLEKFDFTEMGRIPGAIHYRDLYRDHVYMGLVL